MTVREYIGARYVPIFDGYWDATKDYEPLTMVISSQEATAGNSYMSRTYIPAGMPLTNSTYWVLTGEYDAQIASLRYAVDENTEDIGDNAEAIALIQETIAAINEQLENYPDGILVNNDGVVTAATTSDIIGVAGTSADFRVALGAQSNGVWGKNLGGVGVSTPPVYNVSANSMMQVGVLNFIDRSSFSGLKETRYGCFMSIGGTLKYDGSGNAWVSHGNLGMGTLATNYRPLVDYYTSYDFYLPQSLILYTITIWVEASTGKIYMKNSSDNNIPDGAVFPFSISYLTA